MHVIFSFWDNVNSKKFNVLHNILNESSKILLKIFVFHNRFFINFDLP